MKQYILFPSSAIAGFVTAYVISVTLYPKDLNSILNWVTILSLLTFSFGFIYSILLPRAWQRFSEVSLPAKYWAVSLTIIAAAFFSFAYGSLSFVAFLFIGFILISPGLFEFQEFIYRKRAARFITAWIFGGLTSFFALGFFRNFYPSLWEFILFAIFWNAIFTLVLEIILEQATAALRNGLKEKLTSLAVLGLGILLIVLTLRLLVQYPNFFSSDFFLLSPRLTPAFLGLTVLSQSWTASLLQKLDSTNWRSSPFILWTKRNLPGLLLASAISVSTYLMATALVSYNSTFMDMFFQIDSPWWLNYLTAKADKIIPFRAVHPFTLLILRPPVWLFSFLLNGNKYHAALLLNTLFGGGCVYLTWMFFKKRTGNTAYALLMAALLGFSTSHLVLGTFLESYIFSAAALITFVLLLDSKESKFPHIVLAGLITFGITITNFIQTLIGLLLVRRDIKLIFKYTVIVLALAILLAFVQNVLYPKSDPFYVAGRFKSETLNVDSYLDIKPELIARALTSRANAIFRSITLFNMVAPRPIMRFNEAYCYPLCFRTMRYFQGYQYATYVGFGSLLARSWFLGLVIAGAVFAWRFFKSQNQVALQTALLLNLLFNFALHIKYGDDPLLYTPNWTYAVVFFFGMSFERLAGRKLWQIILLVFLIGLFFNNLGLFRKIFENLLPFFP